MLLYVNWRPPAVPWQGAKGTFQLTASRSDCPWTSHTTTNWAQRYPQTGVGSATIEYIIYPSSNTGSRPVTVWIAGQPFTFFQDFNPRSADERFVRLLQFGFLGRVAPQDEVDAQVNLLRGGLSRTDLAVNLSNSAEFNSIGRYIAGLYVGIVGRDAEYTGWLFQRNALLAGVINQIQLVTDFVNSAEYQLKYGHPADDEFVRLLYRNILRREPSQGEVDLEVSKLRSGLSRPRLASDLLNGTEFRTNSGPKLISFLQYATLLQRDAEQWERDFWANLMFSGTTVRTVFSQFINSPEIQILLR